MIKVSYKFIGFLLLVNLVAAEQISSSSLEDAVNSDNRTPAYTERDQFRNPKETLSFFGIKSDMKVVELSPGGGWYTEILAMYIKEPGKLIAAHHDPSLGNYYKRSRGNFEKKMQSDEIYSKVKIVNLGSKLSEDNSVDAVLTFRNLHNWLRGDIEKVFMQSFNSLKPGGIFGVVEHRAKEGTSLEQMIKSGYVTEALAIQLANKAGFVLVGKSEINANGKDSTNHPKGVWTLPPSYRLKEVDRNKYKDIGESDRMTLLFKKPIL
tara:strand:+ start:247 stop:1041 length:795 start_codon:yes stop_codon:yes gene_type:complete